MRLLRFLAPLLFSVSFCAVAPLRLKANIVTFEGFADGTSITTQYVGLTFSNATAITAGLSLNELDFPPHSGANVIFDDGGPISIVFSSPITTFSGYFTYTKGLTLQAFNTSNVLVASVNSAFSANFASSGNPPNEFLQVVAAGISRITITGDQAGNSFTADDLTFQASLPTVATDAAYQVRYAANLDKGESYVNIINTGANGASLFGPGLGASVGNICVNVYAFAPDEQLVACCSCLITPDAVANLGVKRDILVNTITGAPETSMTILLVGTLAGVGSIPVNCSSSAALLTASSVVGGYTAFGTTLHAMPGGVNYFVTETPFIPAAFGTSGVSSHLASITNRCTSILGNGSGFGICPTCQTGALGAARKE